MPQAGWTFIRPLKSPGHGITKVPD